MSNEQKQKLKDYRKKTQVKQTIKATNINN